MVFMVFSSYWQMIKSCLRNAMIILKQENGKITKIAISSQQA